MVTQLLLLLFLFFFFFVFQDFFFDYSPYTTMWDEAKKILSKYPSFDLLESDEERRKVFDEYAQEVIRTVEGTNKRKEPAAEVKEEAPKPKRAKL